MSFRGEIREFELPDILQLIASQNKAGWLKVMSRGDCRFVFFRDGKITSTKNPTDETDPFEMYLTQRALVSPDAMDRVAAIRNVVGEDNVSTLDANRFAGRLLGDTIFANVLLLGAAWQQGLVPVSLDAMMRAIELNGVAIEKNKQAFSWGRIAAVDPERVQQVIDGDNDFDHSLDALVQRRAAFLVEYQDQALADRYLGLVNRVREAGDDDLALPRAVVLEKPFPPEDLLRALRRLLVDALQREDLTDADSAMLQQQLAGVREAQAEHAQPVIVAERVPRQLEMEGQVTDAWPFHRSTIYCPEEGYSSGISTTRPLQGTTWWIWKRRMGWTNSSRGRE